MGCPRYWGDGLDLGLSGRHRFAGCQRKQMVLDTVSLTVETTVPSQFPAAVSEGDLRTGRMSAWATSCPNLVQDRSGIVGFTVGSGSCVNHARAFVAGCRGRPTTVEASMLIQKAGEELLRSGLGGGVGGSPDLLAVLLDTHSIGRIAHVDGRHWPVPTSW